MSLSPAPLSLLIKAAPVLTEEMYGDIHPAAWELLLSVDEHMAGAAGKGTKPVSVACLTAQLTAGYTALQDSSLVEEVLMISRVFLKALWFSQTFLCFCGLYKKGGQKDQEDNLHNSIYGQQAEKNRTGNLCLAGFLCRGNTVI